MTARDRLDATKTLLDVTLRNWKIRRKRIISTTCIINLRPCTEQSLANLTLSLVSTNWWRLKAFSDFIRQLHGWVSDSGYDVFTLLITFECTLTCKSVHAQYAHTVSVWIYQRFNQQLKDLRYFFIICAVMNPQHYYCECECIRRLSTSSSLSNVLIVYETTRAFSSVHYTRDPNLLNVDAILWVKRQGSESNKLNEKVGRGIKNYWRMQYTSAWNRVKPDNFVALLYMLRQ